MVIPSLALDIHGFWFYRAEIEFDPKLGRDEVKFSYTDLYYKGSAGPIIRWIDLCFLCVCLFCMIVANTLLIWGLKKARKKFQHNGKTSRSIMAKSNNSKLSELGGSCSDFQNNAIKSLKHLESKSMPPTSDEPNGTKSVFKRIRGNLAGLFFCTERGSPSKQKHELSEKDSTSKITERCSSIETISSNVYLGPALENKEKISFPWSQPNEIETDKTKKNQISGQIEKDQASNQDVQNQVPGDIALVRAQNKATHNRTFGQNSFESTPESSPRQRTKNAKFNGRLKSQRNKEKQDARITRLLILIIAVYAALYIPLMVSLAYFISILNSNHPVIFTLGLCNLVLICVPSKKLVLHPIKNL